MNEMPELLLVPLATCRVTCFVAPAFNPDTTRNFGVDRVAQHHVRS